MSSRTEQKWNSFGVSHVGASAAQGAAFLHSYNSTRSLNSSNAPHRLRKCDRAGMTFFRDDQSKMGVPEDRTTVKADPEESNQSNEGSSGGPVLWDAEEDHLLSYFLDDVAGGSGGHQHHHNQHRVPIMASSSASYHHRDKDDDDSDDVPRSSRMTYHQPSTPVVHFYAHGGSSSISSSNRSKSKSRVPPVVSSASSSSSSLSSLAATLVTGGPVLQQQIQHNLYQKHQQQQHYPHMHHHEPHEFDSNQSPISPAAIIGSGHENLMLPPPPRFPSGTSTNTAGMEDRNDAEKQQHLAWLQHINTMAVMASHQSGPVLQTSVTVTSSQSAGQPSATGPSNNHQTAMPGYPPIAPIYTSHMHVQQQPPVPPPSPTTTLGESEERRARRLARNRESARQSRRRKKEHLSTLAQKVDRLYTDIETERRRQINLMEDNLTRQRKEQITKLASADGEEALAQPQQMQQRLEYILRRTGPNSPTREAVASFQYQTLKQTLLPKYQEYLLWLTVQPEPFFTAGKDEKLKTDNSPIAKVTGGRVSSKQIGEEITNAWNSSRATETDDSGLDPPSVSCHALDAPRMWPLLCYELSVSVDQEERIVQTHKRTQKMSKLSSDRVQMALATKMATSMKKGVLFQCHAAAMRSDTAMLNILTPDQCLKFLTWFNANNERCQEMLSRRKCTTDTLMIDGKETSLSDICKRLDEALRLPKSDVKEGEPEDRIES